MKRDAALIAGSGLDQAGGKSRMPAILDVTQSVSGLLLALFMWGHLVLVSSILVSMDAMYTVTKMFEGYFLFGRSYHWIVTLAVFAVICLFVLHAALAMRKFPAGFRQYRAMQVHRTTLKHSDTSLWFVQVYTGFALFFLGSAHLFFMLVEPDEIGPYASADRVWAGTWLIDLPLLLAVSVHAGIGVYRLAVKWDWPRGLNAAMRRRTLKRAIWLMTAVFLLVGLFSLGTYMKIGSEHRDRAGERYRPSAMQQWDGPAHLLASPKGAAKVST